MLAAVVDNMLIDLVHNGVDVILDAKIGDGFQFIISKHLAAGIGGVTDQNSLDAGLEGVLNDLGIKIEGGRHQGNEHRLTVGKNGLGAVVLKIGGEHGDLVAGVGQGKDGVHHGLRGADGDDHIRVGVQGAAHKAAGLPGQRLAEVWRAHGDGVLVRTQGTDFGQTVGQSFGRVEVRKALGQVDGVVGYGNPRHAADNGIGELGAFSAHGLHRSGPPGC